MKYISIKAVLYDLSLTIDDRYWNEIYSLEHATKAARTIRAELALQDKLVKGTVSNHKYKLPIDFRYLTQVAYKTESQVSSEADYLSLPENSDITIYEYIYKLPYRPMRLTTNPYHLSICLDETLYNCPDCTHTFSISPDLTLTTTLKEGEILVAYKGYPTDSDGYMMIPDDETYKEAILHYVLYRYWMVKYQMKEDGADSRMNHHLTMWSTLSKKALNVNAPSVAALENLKNIHTRLVPRSERFNQMFLTLASSEKLDF